jgi:protein TonB
MFEALHRTRAWRHTRALAVAAVSAVLVACASKPPTAPKPPPPAPKPVPRPAEPAPLPPPEPAPHRISSATNILDYRKEVAEHLYALHRDELYVGKMPPLLYAVGVLQTDIDKRGYVTGVRWMRAPSHAPEVMAQIEAMVRAAAPYPAPWKLGSVTYTETWLWHKGGRWQLHTLTEGQN